MGRHHENGNGRNGVSLQMRHVNHGENYSTDAIREMYRGIAFENGVADPELVVAGSIVTGNVSVIESSSEVQGHLVNTDPLIPRDSLLPYDEPTIAGVISSLKNGHKDEAISTSPTIEEDEDKEPKIADPFENLLPDIPKAHIDWFNPDRSTITNARDTLIQFFGKDAAQYARLRSLSLPQRRLRKLRYLQRHSGVNSRQYDQMHQKRLNNLRNSIDEDQLLRAIAKIYPVATQDPKTALDRQIRHTNSVFHSIQRHSAPRLSGAIDLKTEVELGITDTTEIVDSVFGTNNDPRFQWEAGRHLAAMITVARLDTYMILSGAEERQRDVTRLFSTDLFDGKRGAGVRKDFVIVRDKNTLEGLHYEELDLTKEQRDALRAGEITIEDLVPHDPNTESLYRLPLEMRKFKDSGILAHYKPRKKDMAAAFVKAAQEAADRRAKGEDGTIDPLRVKDLMGMKFIVDDKGDPGEVTRAIDQVFNIFADNNIGFDVEPDDKTNGTADQSKKYKHRRIKIFGMGDNGLPISFEIIFQTILENYNAQHSIGELEEENGRYNGPFHPGYDTERLIKQTVDTKNEDNEEITIEVPSILELMYPETIYDTGALPIDMLDAARRTKNRKAAVELLP